VSGAPEQSQSSTAQPQATTAPDWKRFGRGTVVPILLLLALLFFLGHLHIDLAGGYMAPRVAADAEGAFVFYDEGSRGDPAFYLRRTRDGAAFGPKTRVSGVLAGVALSGEHLVGLFAPQSERQRWFLSIYERDDLERTWSEEIDDPDLRLTHPRHVAALDGPDGPRVYVFGTDDDGALRVAALARTGDKAGLLALPEPRLAGATVLPPTDEDEGAEANAIVDPGRSRPTGPPGAVRFDSAVLPARGPNDGARLLLVWRVTPDGKPAGDGVLRWTTFDGEAFGELGELPVDLAAIAAVVADGLGADAARPLVLGAPRGLEEPEIRAWALEEDAWVEAEAVPYEPAERLTGAGAIHSLAADLVGERLVLFAQVGGSIRSASRADGEWSEWVDFARLPVEQRAVVYGWFLALLTLCGVLVFQGYRRYTDRGRRARPAEGAALEAFCRPVLGDEDAGAPAAAGAGEAGEAAAPASPAGAEAAPAAALELPATLAERSLAFASDLLLVCLLAVGLAELVPEAVERAAGDPRARLALVAIFLGALVGYFTLFETLFARTPGKWLLRLEVQDLRGGRPGRTALLYRNLFRIELIVPPPYPVALISVVVMLFSRHRQRPGDLVARTVVRRSA